MYTRLLNIKLPKHQSAFLWGARKTGKSTYLHATFQNPIYLDLLEFRLVSELSKNPGMLESIINLQLSDSNSPLVIIDEVQKVPSLLDEIHRLIETKKMQFILCGSSARKLKRGQANLLGGRAWRFEMLPLCSYEIKNMDLIRAMNSGLLPSHFDSPEPLRDLEAYIVDFVREEIMAEALTRNIPAFSRFLDAAAYSNGSILNYTTIARDCGVDAKTVKTYFEILADTMLGYFVYPFRRNAKRKDIVANPKFYFFDVGVANYLAKKTISELRGDSAGHAFEHLVYMELKAYSVYRKRRWDINFWATHSQMEIDFIIGDGTTAIEVKISKNFSNKDLRGLFTFLEESSNAKGIVVVPDCIPHRISHKNQSVEVVPWAKFTELLWEGKLG